jgi:hypothetical protein
MPADQSRRGADMSNVNRMGSRVLRQSTINSAKGLDATITSLVKPLSIASSAHAIR